MLVPAILYKEEILKNLTQYNYSNDMLLYSGWLGNSQPTIDADNNDSSYQYAIVDGDKLVGYFTYSIDWYVSCAHCFGLFSFDRGNWTIGRDVYKELKKLINDYHIHRIEWRMIGGNPVERHYDKFCNKYNGKKHVFTDVVRDRYGNYHDDVVYEIIFDQKPR